LLSYGIDLAGTEKRKSGICILNGDLRATTCLLTSDPEMVGDVRDRRPDLVAIDAPLSIPVGRTTLEDRSGPHLRACDRELLRMRIKFFPITLGPMRSLTRRGIALKNVLEVDGFRVIEVYPGAAQDLLGIPRKQEGLRHLINGLRSLGIKGIPNRATDDELDAVTAAYVGLLTMWGRAMSLGDPSEGLIYVPMVKKTY